MDIGSIFLILALFIGVVIFITRPFFTRQGASKDALAVSKASSLEHDRSSLMAERDRVLNALQELDFDYALGKIPQEDYPAQRTRLLTYGADVLRKLDEINGHPEPSGADGSSQGTALSVEERVESAVALRRADGAATPRPGNGGKVVSSSVAAPDDELEVMLANRRRALRNSGNEQPAGFCPKCGNPLHHGDRFCPKCGLKLA